MTEYEAKEKLAKWCIGEAGYHEGANNYNKYAAIPAVQQMLSLGAQAQNQPWCCIFIVAAMEECFGAETACKMLRSSMHNVAAYVSGLVGVFQKQASPKVGDMVAYNNFNHIGIVVSVNPLKMVDGNYSDGVNYHWGTSDVCGYYTPDYYYATKEEATESSDDDGEEEKEKSDFAVGDWVYCSADRDYSGMFALNAIVKADGPWKIKYLNGDRAVLGENLKGTHDIMTPVKTSTLIKYEEVVVSNLENTTSSESADSSDETAGKNSAQAETQPVIFSNKLSQNHIYGGKIINIEERGH